MNLLEIIFRSFWTFTGFTLLAFFLGNGALLFTAQFTELVKDMYESHLDYRERMAELREKRLESFGRQTTTAEEAGVRRHPISPFH